MARKFYTCIIVPNASQQLHKLRVPVQALYVLSVIGAVSFFVAIGLGFNYLGMATKVANYETIEAENARLRIDTKRLQLSTYKLDAKLNDLEDRTQKITQAIESDGLFRRLGNLTRTAGGSRKDLSTAELVSKSQKGKDNVESMRTRILDLEDQLGQLDEKTKLIRSMPMVSPLLGRIGSDYGARPDPFTGVREIHTGLDIVAPFGSAIKAPADGIVIFAQRQSDYGNLVILRHGPQGLTTRYGHLRGFNVRLGQTVHRGDVIGYVGVTGRTTAPHLHYEVRLNDRPQNPRTFIVK